MKPITWIPFEAELRHIAKTPTNYKIKNALGRERLKETLKKFGLSDTLTCNWNSKVGNLKDLVLVDGNSRHDEELAKGNDKRKVWVSLPDRKLTPAEFKEFSAMKNAAAAGDVDYERINGDIGKTKDFYERYQLAIPKHLLDKLGSAKLKEYKKDKAAKKASSTALKVTDDRNLNDIMMVQLMYPKTQMEKFRAFEAKVAAWAKTKDVHATVFAAMEYVSKQIKGKSK